MRPFTSFLREVRLFVQLPLAMHASIVWLLYNLLVKKGRPNIRRSF